MGKDKTGLGLVHINKDQPQPEQKEVVKTLTNVKVFGRRGDMRSEHIVFKKDKEVPIMVLNRQVGAMDNIKRYAAGIGADLHLVEDLQIERIELVLVPTTLSKGRHTIDHLKVFLKSKY